MLTAKEVEERLTSDGSIFTLKAVHPFDISDPELAHFWGLAKNKLAEFERAEDEIARILDHRYAKGWQS